MNGRLAHSSRQDILRLLNGEDIGRVPCFSGLVNITQAGLESLGLRFSEIHTDARKLASAAATSYEFSDFESAVVPADLCVEASALGAQVDFRADVDLPMFPIAAAPLAEHAGDFRITRPADLLGGTRVAIVLQALHLLKQRVGERVVVGAWVPGPFTLATQLIALDNLYTDVRQAPKAVAAVLATLADVLIEVARGYQAAGADFLTIHEMGGSPGVIGPRSFEKLVLPALRRLIAALHPPRVLSVCGNTNSALDLLAQSGAEALSVDQMNDVARSKKILGDRIRLFGNIDPVAVLQEGDESSVRLAVHSAREAGVDAIWPGCDLPPTIPAENMRALISASRDW